MTDEQYEDYEAAVRGLPGWASPYPSGTTWLEGTFPELGQVKHGDASRFVNKFPYQCRTILYVPYRCSDCPSSDQTPSNARRVCVYARDQVLT
jgi:hypothetical protein